MPSHYRVLKLVRIGAPQLSPAWTRSQRKSWIVRDLCGDLGLLNRCIRRRIRDALGVTARRPSPCHRGALLGAVNALR